MSGIISSISKYGAIAAGTIAIGAYGAANAIPRYCPEIPPLPPIPEPTFLERYVFSWFQTHPEPLPIKEPLAIDAVCETVKPYLPNMISIFNTAAPIALALGCVYAAHRYLNKPASPEKANNPASNVGSSLLRLIPFAGVIGGIATGLDSRFSDLNRIFADFSYKAPKVCRSLFSDSPLLSSINGWKQWEIRNFALLTPLVPLAAKIVYDAAKSEDDKNVLSKLWDAAKNNLTKSQAVSLVLTITLGLTSELYGPMLGIISVPSKNGGASTEFDASGHIMLKTLLAHNLSHTLQQIAADGGNVTKSLAALYGLLYAFTDGVLVHATTNVCHTVPETFAGLGLGLGILGIGKIAKAIL